MCAVRADLPTAAIIMQQKHDPDKRQRAASAGFWQEGRDLPAILLCFIRLAHSTSSAAPGVEISPSPQAERGTPLRGKGRG